ncbi:MAG TPA: hypothetical protein VLH17_01755 [Candidatus Binatia bacterium]|jgi:hypothetical protein|nr:hypothetical protein [Candidatus Binatia bacterium]
MLSSQRGDAAAAEIQRWAGEIARRIDPDIGITVEFDADSNTFILRLIKGSRVLIFRFSEAQVHTDGREAECERTLNRKIKDLWNLL